LGSSPKPGNNGTSLAAIARPEHLGYAGRLVLVSRKWSGKTFKDHRGDRGGLADRHARPRAAGLG